MENLTIEDKLGRNRFKVDEHTSHVLVDKEYIDPEEIKLVCLACPAGLYKVSEDGALHFDHLGCLECGTCRVLSDGRVVTGWDYPLGGFGVSYRCG